MAEIRHELVGFPNATHDDICDSMGQFADWVANSRIARGLGSAGARDPGTYRPR